MAMSGALLLFQGCRQIRKLLPPLELQLLHVQVGLSLYHGRLPTDHIGQAGAFGRSAAPISP